MADEEDFAHDFRETYQRRGYSLLISPTVVSELYFFQLDGDAEEQRLGSLAIKKLISWDVQAFPLTGVQLALARTFYRRLLPESEINDARILAETSIAGIPLVVSSDHHLLEIDPDALREVCVAADLCPVFSTSPRRLVRALR